MCPRWCPTKAESKSKSKDRFVYLSLSLSLSPPVSPPLPPPQLIPNIQALFWAPSKAPTKLPPFAYPALLFFNFDCERILSSALKAQGKYKETLPIYKRCLKTEERVFGPEHPSTLKTASNLAHTLDELNKERL